MKDRQTAYWRAMAEWLSIWRLSVCLSICIFVFLSLWMNDSFLFTCICLLSHKLVQDEGVMEVFLYVLCLLVCCCCFVFVFAFFLQRAKRGSYFAGSCSKADCTLGDWSEWEGAVEEGTCAEQRRTRGYTIFVVYELHLDKCPTLPQGCPKPNEQKRIMCKTWEW